MGHQSRNISIERFKDIHTFIYPIFIQMHFYCIEKLNAVVTSNNISHGAFEQCILPPTASVNNLNNDLGVIKVWTKWISEAHAFCPASHSPYVK